MRKGEMAPVFYVTRACLRIPEDWGPHVLRVIPRRFHSPLLCLALPLRRPSHPVVLQANIDTVSVGRESLFVGHGSD